MISIFDGNEDAYWWLLCAEKSFNERRLSDAEKLTEIASAMRGSGLTWWIWWSLRHPKLSWEPFTVAPNLGMFCHSRVMKWSCGIIIS